MISGRDTTRRASPLAPLVACFAMAAKGKGGRLCFLLSPAKTLVFNRPHPELSKLPCTKPALASQSKHLLGVLQKKTQSDLKKLFSVSDAIARLNYERFQTWDDLPELQAALAFDGQAYQGLRAWELNLDDLEWLNGSLRILSGFYGIIKPFDAIKAYRLEMGTKLATSTGKDLYNFWGRAIAESLAEVRSSADAHSHSSPQTRSLTLTRAHTHARTHAHHTRSAISPARRTSTLATCL